MKLLARHKRVQKKGEKERGIERKESDELQNAEFDDEE